MNIEWLEHSLDLSGAGVPALVIAIVVGVIFALLGYRFLKVVLGLVGLVGGAGLTYYIFGLCHCPWPHWIIIVISVLVGIVIMILSYKIYKLGIFASTGILTYMVLAAILSTVAKVGLNTVWLIIVCAILALVVAVLAVIFTRPIMIITTSITGAQFIIAATAALIPHLPDWAAWIIFIGVAVIGMFVQFSTTKHMK